MELFVTVRSDYGLEERLDVPESKIAEMQRNLRSPSQRKEAYLDLYATGHPCPNWRQVAKALGYVGLYYQARTVERTYVQGIDTNAHIVCDSHCMAKEKTFPVTLMIIVCVNLKAGADHDTVCLGAGVYLCKFHIVVRVCFFYRLTYG